MLDKVLNEQKVKELKGMLENSANIVLTCHVRPDGDAIGSILGLWHLLQSWDKQRRVAQKRTVTCLTPDQMPRSLWFLPGSKEVVAYTRYPDYGKRLLEEADLVVCCDFNKPERQGQLAELVQGCGARKVLIDHHQKPDDFASLTFSFPEMSSTCELVFRLIAAMGWYPYLTKEGATCLCTGLITDTRNFSVNCKSHDIYSILTALLDKGVDKQKIVKEALETKSLESVKLQAYALSEKLELFSRNRAALVTLDKKELERFRYERGDSEGLVNAPLEIRDVICSFFLREDPDCVKMSARSVDNFPVSEICEDLFGGGGHIMAAGGEFYGSIEECRRILLDNFKDYEQYFEKRDRESE